MLQTSCYKFLSWIFDFVPLPEQRPDLSLGTHPQSEGQTVETKAEPVTVATPEVEKAYLCAYKNAWRILRGCVH